MPSTRPLCFLAVMLSAAVLPAVASADIYRFVDENGVTHFKNVKGNDPRFSLFLKDEGRKGKRRPGVNPVMPSDASMERFTRYDEHIVQAATLYQLPVEFVRAIMMVESNYDPRAVSPAGATGLMQLMPETAERMECRDITDPRENIFGGTRYLRVLANLFNGDLELTIAGYNAGEGAVMRYGGIPPYPETQDYVVKVLTYYRRYRATRDALAASVGTEER